MPQTHFTLVLDFTKMANALIKDLFTVSHNSNYISFRLSLQAIFRIFWAILRIDLHPVCLDMAEIELSILSRQCMNDYFECRKQLKERIVPWERSRNDRQVGINWRFTTADARIKLKRLYPTL